MRTIGQETAFQIALRNFWRCKGKVSIYIQFSHSVVSDSLWPHESLHARSPCPSPTPGVHSNSHPSSRWCHPAISSSVIPFSSCSRSLPASESTYMYISIYIYIWFWWRRSTCSQAHMFLQKVTACLMKLSEGHEAHTSPWRILVFF